MRTYLTLLATILTVSFELLTFSSFSQDGSLDSTFSGDGIRIDSTGSHISQVITSAVLQPDGKTVIVGYFYNLHEYFIIARYNSNGTSDSTFNSTGVKIDSAGAGSENYFRSTAIQSDGKIVAVGASNNHFALLRYDSNGKRDSSFSDDGILTDSTAIGVQNIANSVVIQQDGKIVIAGVAAYTYGNYFIIFRYNSDGTRDSTFSEDGIKVDSSGANMDNTASAVTIQPDGKIVVAGTTNSLFTVLRYNSDGTRDSTFSGDGLQIDSLGSNNYSSIGSVAIQADGKIVTAGFFSNDSQEHFATLRYNSNGMLDNTFSEDGIKIDSIGTGLRCAASSALIQPDGKIVLAGYFGVTSNYDFALLRYNSDGTRDNTFNGTGVQTEEIGTSDLDPFVVIQPDGKLIMAGTSFAGGDYFTLLRFNNTIRITTPCTANYTTTYDSIFNAFTINVDSATTAMAVAYHWDFGDGTTSELSTPTHAYFSDTLFNVCMKVFYADGDSCIYCHTIGIDSSGNIVRGGFTLNIHNATTGISEKSVEKNAISIYPNPGTGIFYLTMDRSIGKQLTIYNVIGDIIYSKDLQQVTDSFIINLSDQPNGIYFVQLSNEKGSVSKKISICK